MISCGCSRKSIRAFRSGPAYGVSDGSRTCAGGSGGYIRADAGDHPCGEGGGVEAVVDGGDQVSALRRPTRTGTERIAMPGASMAGALVRVAIRGAQRRRPRPQRPSVPRRRHIRRHFRWLSATPRPGIRRLATLSHPLNARYITPIHLPLGRGGQYTGSNSPRIRPRSLFTG
jgi:hypothetical protein